MLIAIRNSKGNAVDKEHHIQLESEFSVRISTPDALDEEAVLLYIRNASQHAMQEEAHISLDTLLGPIMNST
jgi:hypothetical protein